MTPNIIWRVENKLASLVQHSVIIGHWRSQRSLKINQTNRKKQESVTKTEIEEVRRKSKRFSIPRSWADAEMWKGQIVKLWKKSQTSQKLSSNFSAEKQKKTEGNVKHTYVKMNSQTNVLLLLKSLLLHPCVQVSTYLWKEKLNWYGEGERGSCPVISLIYPRWGEVPLWYVNNPIFYIPMLYTYNQSRVKWD